MAKLRLDRPPFYPELDDAGFSVRVKGMRLRSEAKANAARGGRRVLGMKKARKIHWNTLATPEEMFGRRPTFAAAEATTRRMLARLRRAFLNAYAVALAAYKSDSFARSLTSGARPGRRTSPDRISPDYRRPSATFISSSASRPALATSWLSSGSPSTGFRSPLPIV